MTEMANRPDVEDALAVEPEVPPTVVPLGTGTLRDYGRSYVARLRAGDTGLLPVIAGLIIIAIVFQLLNSKFLTALNLVNLLVQGAAYMVIAMGVVFVLLLGEVDLSVGFVAGLGGVVAAELVKASIGQPWWVAVIVALLVTTGIGAAQGLIITLLGVPSFVVTLAGFLAWRGVMLLVLGNGGTLPLQSNVLVDVANGLITPAAGWIIMVVSVVLFAAAQLYQDTSRRRHGLATVPRSLVFIKIAVAAAAGIVVVLICNANRGALVSIRGVPWVVLIVLALVALWTFVTTRTRFGRYIYAVGGNAEAARRAGINLTLTRTAGFAIAGFMAGIGGIILASRLSSVATDFDGGNLVLYCIAAAVIGGTSLFGGRGKVIHGVLGGLVIAGIDNGMGLLGISAATKFVITALVLLAAVTVDAVARRGRTSSGLN
jgi:D-xylose transport system permease protein